MPDVLETLKKIAARFLPKREQAFDLTAWLSRSAEVSAFDLPGHISTIDQRSRGALATAFAIRVTRPLAMEAV